MSATPQTTENVIEILANLQVFLRKPIIKNKLLDFYKLEKDDQIEIINLVLESIPNVDVSTFQELITSWFEVLSKFDNKKITYIMQIYLEEIVKRSDLISKLIPPVSKAIKNMKEDEKEILRICFLETLFTITINFRKEIIKNLDISSLDLLKITK